MPLREGGWPLVSASPLPYSRRSATPAELAEGGPPPKIIVIVEFPTMARLREWYASAEYAEALKVRRTALDRRLIFVEGVPAV